MFGPYSHKTVARIYKITYLNRGGATESSPIIRFLSIALVILKNS